MLCLFNMLTHEGREKHTGGDENSDGAKDAWVSLCDHVNNKILRQMSMATTESKIRSAGHVAYLLATDDGLPININGKKTSTRVVHKVAASVFERDSGWWRLVTNGSGNNDLE